MTSIRQNVSGREQNSLKRNTPFVATSELHNSKSTLCMISVEHSCQFRSSILHLRTILLVTRRIARLTMLSFA